MTVVSSRDEAANLIENFATASGVSCNAITARHALPHLTDKMVGSHYINALKNLNAQLQSSKVKLSDLEKSDLP